MEEKQVVLSVKDLKINFSTDHGYVQAVRGVSFDLYRGETLKFLTERTISLFSIIRLLLSVMG